MAAAQQIRHPREIAPTRDDLLPLLNGANQQELMESLTFYGQAEIDRVNAFALDAFEQQHLNDIAHTHAGPWPVEALSKEADLAIIY